MATALDIITRSLRDLGVLAAGEVAAFDDANDGLIALNALVDQLKAERLAIFAEVNTTWALVPNQASYTVGLTGDVNIERPVFIQTVNYLDTSLTPDAEFPLNKLTNEEWAGVTFKAQAGTIPSDWWYQPTFPLGTLWLYPIPTGATLRGSIYVPTAVTEFPALNTVFSLPPGYQRMLQKNLALELASSYGADPQPALIEAARDSRAAIKRANWGQVVTDLQFEAAVLNGGSSYSIYEG